MCPDEELLSAYIDNEIQEKWKIQVEEHLAGCSRCSEIVRNYRQMRELLRETDIQVTDSLLERSYHCLNAKRNLQKATPLWGRRIALPIPVFAAAAAVCVFALIFFFTGGFRSAGPALASQSEIIIPTAEVKVSSLEEALRVFESQNAHIDIYIQLPAETNFVRIGEPCFVREADFHPGIQ